MSESNLRQNTPEGAIVFINEYSNFDGRTLGDRSYRVLSADRVGNNVVFRLKAHGHDFGDREAIVDSMNRITTRVIMNGVPSGLESTYNRNGNVSQGGKKKRKSLKKRKTKKRKSLKKKRNKTYRGGRMIAKKFHKRFTYL